MSFTQSNSVQVVTFGCRLNVYESEIIHRFATEAGLGRTFIINSCAVTQEAERQVRQTIRKLRREHPSAHIIVTGCSAQTNPSRYEKMEEVDHILDNDLKMKKESYLSLSKQERVRLNDVMTIKETASHLIAGFEGKVRAFVQIQNGCDHRCTFCIIPYGRGNSRSVGVGEIISQIQYLLENGYQEIVLTGVDLTSYGKDLPGTPSLGALCKRILRLVPSLHRLGLSSLDPSEIDKELWDVIKDNHQLMPHLHLSLQAGDNLILKRMKRRHLRHQAIECCQKAKTLRPDIVLGADLIAGFPTETEEMFLRTLNIIKECDLTYLHVFPYSPRPGTPASRMPQVDKKIIKERASLLRQEGGKALCRYLDSLKNQKVSFLLETVDWDEALKSYRLCGKTDHFASIEVFSSVSFPIGEILSVHITDHNGKVLLGER